MDAYSSYIMNLTNARTADLRREAADYALSAPARRRRRARWFSVLRRLAVWQRASVSPGLPLPEPLPPQAFSNSNASSR